MAASWVILANKLPFLIPTLSLVGVLLFGAVVIALFRRRLRLDETRPEAGNELARYRALYERGELSEKEYHSLRALLAGQLRRSAAGPNAPPRDPEAGARMPTTPDESPGRDLPNTPTDGVRPAE